MTMSQIAVITVNVVADAPSPRQGDTDASPSPDPSAIRMRDTEAATNAPARMAGHETAELKASTDEACSLTPGACAAKRVFMVAVLAALSYASTWREEELPESVHQA